VERVDDPIQIEEVLIAARASAAESETRKREEEVSKRDTRSTEFNASASTQPDNTMVDEFTSRRSCEYLSRKGET
jgi:hypothetical protein